MNKEEKMLYDVIVKWWGDAETQDKDPLISDLVNDITKMRDEKIEKLIDLFFNVIYSLKMTQYKNEDESEAAKVIHEADQYFQQMLDILHS